MMQYHKITVSEQRMERKGEATLFQAEVTIMIQVVTRVEIRNRLRSILIYSDSQKALKDIYHYKMRSRSTEITVKWVSGNRGVKGKEWDDEFANAVPLCYRARLM